jgi:8-oxo-dGTP pyrophosphatase MutT (NUDIX family)
VNLSKLKFTKRKDFYSLYVEGFVLDKVGKVEEASRAGYIPFKWLAPGGWLKMSEPPPEEFWRTLVADRGPNGRNAPSFYTRACHESFKRTIWGEPVNTRQLIDEGRCTIVAEFLRRVQAVIWNRLLMRTGKGRLGLVHETTKEGDLICILYGCSVPVVLRKFDKTDAQIKEEQVEDELELEKLKREAVDKIQAAYLARLQRIRQKKLKKGKMHPYKVKVDWKRYWNYTRHIAVVALALYLKVWDQLAPESLKLAGFVSFAILLGIFPGVLVWQARRLRLTMGRNMPTWMKRTPKTTGLCQVRRSNDCYYQLIGPCYVHGMMNGEAIQFQNDNGVHPEVFDLR